MQFKICIIEKEPAYILQLEACLHEWAGEKECEILIERYHACEEFFQEQKKLNYHIFFLGMEIGKMNGVGFAEYLREQDYMGEIAFLSSCQEHAVDGYYVHAIAYLLTPLLPEKIFYCMDSLLEQYTEAHYKYSYRKERVNIPYEDILYFSSEAHNIEIVTATRRYKQFRSFHTLKGSLPKQFLQCNRGIIINVDHILQMNSREVTLTNEIRLPVSATYSRKVREAFSRGSSCKA